MKAFFRLGKNPSPKTKQKQRRMAVKQEFFDIRDKNGDITGEIKERSQVHKDGDFHGTVHIWVIKKTVKGYDVLLQKRSKDKDSFPECYDISSAGHLEAGHDYLETAIRELSEELGIWATQEELEFFGFHEGFVETEFYGEPFVNHEISAMYLYHIDPDKTKLCLQADEVETVEFFDYMEGRKLIKNNRIRHCIFQDEYDALGEKLGLQVTGKVRNNCEKK